MPAYFDGTLEEAANCVSSQACLSRKLGPPVATMAVKMAFTRPESAAQALTWLRDPPTVGGRVDPAWGTLGKAVLGAGLGAGAGGIASLINKKRRKQWLRNMLLGGLLGGGIGTGVGLATHGLESLEGGPPGESLQRQRTELAEKIEGMAANNENIPEDAKNALAVLDKEIAEQAGKEVSDGAASSFGELDPNKKTTTLSDKLWYAKNMGGDGSALDKAKATEPLLASDPVTGITAGAGGVATGAVANKWLEQRHAKKTNLAELAKDKPLQQRIQSLGNRDFKKVFGKDWQLQKRRITSLTPAYGGSQPGSFNEAFANKGTAPRHMKQPTWNKLVNRADRLKAKPNPRITGGKTWMGLLGGLGYLAPQLAPHADEIGSGIRRSILGE